MRAAREKPQTDLIVKKLPTSSEMGKKQVGIDVKNVLQVEVLVGQGPTLLQNSLNSHVDKNSAPIQKVSSQAQSGRSKPEQKVRPNPSLQIGNPHERERPLSPPPFLPPRKVNCRKELEKTMTIATAEVAT